jgi:hypothetical protein
VESNTFQVILEYQDNWPPTGPLHIEVGFSGDVAIAPTTARQRIAGYVASQISMALRAGPPSLVAGPHPRWRVPISVHLPGIQHAESGVIHFVDVDAATGEVVQLTSKQIAQLQEQAHAFATSLPYPPAPAG